MSFLAKRPRVTFDNGFLVPETEDSEDLMVVQVPTDEEEADLSPTSLCSFTFSYPSASSSPISSPVSREVEEEEQEKEEDDLSSTSLCSFTFSYPSASSSPMSSPVSREEEEEEVKEEGVKEEVKEEGVKEEEEQEEQKVPAVVTLDLPQSPQSCGPSPPSGSQEEADASCLQMSACPDPGPRDPLEEKVKDLVQFMILKYQSKEPFTKAEMLKVVIKSHKKQFPVIFKRASKWLEVIAGIDVKEVDPTIHSYVLLNSLEMLGDKEGVPKSGLLIIILGVIFIEGNRIPEEDIWDFLNVLGVYAGREHFLYGEPWKLLTRDWVQQNYLEYRQVPNSDPPRYEFLWGSRAYAETNAKKILEFLAKIKGTDPISFSCWYEEALRDEEERARTRIKPRHSPPTTVTEQQGSAASPAPGEE